MASSLNSERPALKDQQKDMEFSSKEVQPAMTFYLHSLEEQVRCDLLDSEARLTPTTSEGRVLLEIDEDRLQHFLDVLSEKNTTKSTEGEMALSENYQEKAVSKDFCEAPMDKQKADSNNIAAALKESQDLLKDARRQWEEEKSSLAEQYKHASDLYQNQVKVIADYVRKQREDKQTLLREQAAHKSQMEKQKAETNKIAAALKHTKDLLDHERRVRHQSTNKNETELVRSLKRYRTLMDEDKEVTGNLRAALHKADQELKDKHQQWEEERSSLLEQNKKDCELYHAQVKLTADIERTQKMDSQMLQKFLAGNKGRLEEQKAENKTISAALKDTEYRLQAEHARFLEQSSLVTELEQTCNDLKHAQMMDKIANPTLEQEITRLTNRNLRSQALLVEQKAEADNTAAVLKNTEELLDAERLRLQEQQTAIEHLEQTCKDQRLNTDRIKAARKKTEDLLETERFLWEQERSSILQATEEQLLQSQNNNKEKKKGKKWFKLFKKTH